MGRRVEVDRQKCGATGNCVFWAPDTFDQDDRGLATVQSQPVRDWKAVERAVANCPTNALRIVEE